MHPIMPQCRLLPTLAYAFLAVTAAERAHDTITYALIPLTCNEIRHLFIHLTSRAGHGVRAGGRI